MTSRDGATMTAAMRMAVLGIAITGCGQNLDSVVWDCQLAVQKENAGKSAAADDQRNHDIEACMRARGYRLDVGNPSCRTATTNSTCYQAM